MTSANGRLPPHDLPKDGGAAPMLPQPGGRGSARKIRPRSRRSGSAGAALGYVFQIRDDVLGGLGRGGSDRQACGRGH